MNDSDREAKKEEIKEKLKKIGMGKLLLIVACGVFLLVLSCGDFLGSSSSENSEANHTVTTSATTEKTLEQYKKEMEQQVVDMLGKVEGVGKVEVMITLAASKEKVTLKDNETDGTQTGEQSVVLEDGNSNQNPYVVQEKEPVPEGVLVVCQGGGDARVNREIINAVEVLFDVSAHKIKVMKME